MKATIQIPKGWRRLRDNEEPTCKDRFLYGECFNKPYRWEPFREGDFIGNRLFIRRIARPRKCVPKGYTELTCEQFLADGRPGYSDCFRFAFGKSRKLYTYHECEYIDKTGIRFFRKADK